MKAKREFIKSLTGMRFHRLVVLRRNPGIFPGKTKWDCKCDCGNFYTAFRDGLTRGVTKSCGCLKSELSTKCHTIHGKLDSQEYRAWRYIRNQCNNPTSHCSKYRRQGIKICDRWNTPRSFPLFLEDMGEAPPGSKLVRIDQKGDFSPENCKWAPKQYTEEQIRI